MAISTTTATPASAPSSPIKPEPVPASPAAASPISPASSTSMSPSDVVDVKTDSTTPTPADGAQQPKRRATRRASTAERRATHNAVERIRRETLNGRFLTLASMLPPSRHSVVPARPRLLARASQPSTPPAATASSPRRRCARLPGRQRD
ncbi:hypothetical protein B0H19DRAFT_182974 [Mycena capillaripes]|nr:hypothetical protein B0H19DRAFT_182974 [Mycena capillaripes]